MLRSGFSGLSIERIEQILIIDSLGSVYSS